MKKTCRTQPLQSEGESNVSRRRKEWVSHTHDDSARALLEEDTHYFMDQSVSTPCLSVVTRAEGAYIEDVKGRRCLDFHGNNVHHIGYGHPRLKEAITRQMDALPFAPRRYACETGPGTGKKTYRNRTGQSRQGAFHNQRF